MKTVLLAATFFCFVNFTNGQAGRLDPSFGTNGIVKTGLGNNYNYPVSYVRQILPQPDGDIYIVQAPFSGWQDEGKKSVTRRHSNGSIDSGFGFIANGFSAEAGFDISRAAVQPDGKIIVIGTVGLTENDNVEQADFALARFKNNGSLDSGFANQGKLTTDFGAISDEEGSGESHDEGYTVAIQKDGKIIAAGFSNGYLALARYNSDGSPDKTFSDDGLILSSVYHTFGYPDPISIAIQTDNKIVVAGGFSVIVRFNTDGSLDKIISDNENHLFSAVYSQAIQKDGKIIVADFSSYGLGLARYNTDGTLDTSFSDNGTQILDYGTEVVLQSDQKIIVAGDSIGGYFTIRRFNSDGSLDNTFDKDGKQETNFGFGYNQPYAAAIQPDGKILVGGAAVPYIAIARYNNNGSLDNTFNKDGKLTDGFHAGNTLFKSIAVQKDGKAVSVGRTWNGIAGYGFQLKKGATSLTESWAALEEVSNNHFMLGHIMEWFYSGLAGISQEEGSVAFKHIKIRPQPVGDITSAKGTFHSPYGWITTDWKANNNIFTIKIHIPVNTTATVYVPATAASKVFVNGKLTAKNAFKFKEGSAVLQINSGDYLIEVK